MLMLLCALQPIATQRGDGLHPVLVQMISRSASWTGIEQAIEASSKGNGPRVSEDASRPVAFALSLRQHQR